MFVLKILRCLPATLDFTLPCGQTQLTATMVRQGSPPVTLPHTPFSPIIPTRFSVPQGLQKGVWLFKVKTECGCFTSLIYIACEAPSAVATHHATEADSSPECCLPEGETVLTGTKVLFQSTRTLMAPFPAAMVGQAYTAFTSSRVPLGAGTLTVEGEWLVIPQRLPEGAYLEIET